MNRLNIFIDETGEFGFSKRSAKLYGVSLVFYEQKNNIEKDIKRLKQRLDILSFYEMIHMGDLVNGHGVFSDMDIAKRRKIYNALYHFSTRIKAKYRTVIIDKRNYPNNQILSKAISEEFRYLIAEKLQYFQQFSQIVLYYDGGQKPLNAIIEDTFIKTLNAKQNAFFDHADKKLFQVAYMLTYVDKAIYKYNKGIKLSKTEKSFFSTKSLRSTINELRSHRI